MKWEMITTTCLDNIEELLDYFEVDYIYSGNNIIGACPVHNSNNNKSLSICGKDHRYPGLWKCFTNSCHEEYGKSIIGLIKALLSIRTNSDVNVKQTIEFLEKFLNKKLDTGYDKSFKLDKTCEWFSNNIVSNKLKMKREDYLNKVKMPSSYFLKRGFQEKTLLDYDIGDYIGDRDEFNNRAVIPVYDDRGEYIVGITGRKRDGGQRPKWFHVGELGNALFNFYKARPHILKEGSLFIVESPGNTLKLVEAGINNVVGIFGSSISHVQQILLEQSGALTLYVLSDNDASGWKLSKTTEEKLSRIFNIVTQCVDYGKYNDIGEIPTKEIRERINVNGK